MHDIPSCLPVYLWQWSVCLSVSSRQCALDNFLCVFSNSCTTVLIYPWCVSLDLQVYQQQYVKSVYFLHHCEREFNDSMNQWMTGLWLLCVCVSVRKGVTLTSFSLLTRLIKKVLKLPLSHHPWHWDDRLIMDRRRHRKGEGEGVRQEKKDGGWWNERFFS